MTEYKKDTVTISSEILQNKKSDELKHETAHTPISEAEIKKDNMIKLHSMIATEAAVRLGDIKRDDFKTFYEKELTGRRKYWQNKEFDKYALKEYDDYCRADDKSAWVEKKIKQQVTFSTMLKEQMKGGR